MHNAWIIYRQNLPSHIHTFHPIHAFVYRQGKQMYYLTPYFQVRHQCVGHRCIMHAACVRRPSLCTVKHLALQMQTHTHTHTIFFLLFLILLWTSSSYSKYRFFKENIIVHLPVGIITTSRWYIMCDPYIIDSKAPQVFHAFWKIAICIMYWLIYWERERERIYNSTQAFWWLLPGGFWPLWFFLSDPFIQPFTDPLDIKSVTNWTASVSGSVQCMSFF